jgi:hypothetical protein
VSTTKISGIIFHEIKFNISHEYKAYIDANFNNYIETLYEITYLTLRLIIKKKSIELSY